MGITTEPMDVIEFNGVTSSSLGIIVDGYYAKGTPQRRISTVTVPGKNGTVVEDEGAFENSTQEYTLYWLPDKTTDSAVLNWLRQDGYYDWKHSSMPDYIQKARAILSSQINNYRDCYHELTVTFSLKPEMYLVSGMETVTLTGSQKFRNPTPHEAKPKITVYGNTDSPSKITVGNQVLTVNLIEECLVLDCELQEAYKGAVNKNNTVSGEFPVFPGGAVSEVLFTGGITKVEIQPRWWDL